MRNEDRRKGEEKRKHELMSRSVTVERRVAQSETSKIKQKRTEEELRQSKEWMESIFNFFPDVIAVTDLKGKIAECNLEAVRLFGFRAIKELIGRSVFELISPDDRERVRLKMEETLSRSSVKSAEYTLLKRDGSEFRAEVSGGVVRDLFGKPTSFIIVIKDLSPRMKMEEALSESEEKYRLLVENANEGILVAQDDKHKFVNAKMMEMTGYSEEELVSAPFLGFVHPEDRKMVIDRYRGRLRGEELPHVYPFRIVERSGNTRWVEINAIKFNWNGRPATLSLLTDVTQRKRMEEALRKWTHNLGERVKELNCLYGMSRLVEKEGVSLEEILEGTVNLIPPSWQYPDITCARIILEGRTFQMKKFKETAWKQTSDIVVHGKKLGTVEVFYLEEKPKSDKGPFLKEESSLIDAIADRLGAITGQKKMEGELRDSLERLEILFESAPDGIYLTDLKGAFVDGNKAAERLIGYERKELIGKNFLKLKLLAREYILKAAMNLAKNVLGKPTGPDEFVLNRKDGKQVTVEINTYPAKIKGKPLVLGIARDVTERKEAEKTIRQLAYHDPLTGLPNRRLFNDRLTLALAQAKRKKQGLAVMFLDLDYFKDVNDELGHNLGDRLLEAVGDRLRGLLRRSDTVARMGGDEFLLMLPEVTRVEDTDRIAQKILEEIRKQFVLDGHPINITTSIGIATCPKDGENADLLVKNADMAMYVAKTCGRNNCQRYSIGMNTKVVG